MVNVRKSLVRGTAWIAGARMLTNGLGFISTLVLARILTPADFGLVALATTMLAILTSLTDLSLTSALVQHKDPQQHHFHTAWTFQVIRNTLLGIVFAIAAWPAASIFNEQRIINLMIVLSSSIIIQGFNNPYAIMLTRDLIFWHQFVLQVGAKLVSLIVSIVIAVSFKSYWALIWGTVAGQFFSLVISYMILPFRPKLCFKGGRDLFSFSLYLTFGQMINTVNWKSDQIFIGGYLGRAELGYYTVGDNLAVMPTRELTAPITQTLYPAFSRVKDDLGRLRWAYQNAQAFVTAIALPAGVGTALLAHSLVVLAMGEKWLNAVLVIQVLAAVFAFQTLGSLSQPLAMATDNTRLLFKRDVQGFFIRLPTIIVGMLLAGLPGIIYARALTGSLAIILHMQVVKKITNLGYREQLMANKRSILSVIVMAAMVAFIELIWPDNGMTSLELTVRIATLAAAGAVVYALTHFLLWIAASRPSGPETEIQRAVSRILSRSTS